MGPIRILIVDDHQVVRQGIRSLLSEYAEIQVAGESDGGPATLAQCAELRPDVVLLDIKLADANGLVLGRSLMRQQPELKIIILTSYDNEEYLIDAIRSGMSGYLLKNSSAEILVDTIRAVQNGERRICKDLMTTALNTMEQLGRKRLLDASGLDEEDYQLLRLLAGGANNEELANKLYMSERTVKRKLQELLAKLHASSRAQAVAEGYKRGIL
ncbi:MAG: response regulator transcription factor [Chloroflexi bacterium]|nr:response regulator transcription factor [Anaerolineaceae bacterium]NMB88882.1 response regulator transcription factor [Chloroflexota bacterium]